MKINSIKTLLFGTILSGGALLMSSCSNTEKQITRGLTEYMAEKGNSFSELDSVINSTKNNVTVSRAVLMQSALDSMAFRDLFNQTHLANDSTAVAEFNQIASKYKLTGNVGDIGHALPRKCLKKAMVKDRNVLVKEADSVLSNFPKEKFSLFTLFKTACFNAQNYQYYGDKFFYRKFFEKYNLIPKEGGDSINGRPIRYQFFDAVEKIAPKE